MPLEQLSTIRVDPTRMAQGIMTGIGFLGAGVIMHDKHSVRGLTTAASIWITAAIGILVGAGFYVIGLMACLCALATLSLFRWLEEKVPARCYGRLKIIVASEVEDGEALARKTLKELGFHTSGFSYRQSPSQRLILTTTISCFSRSKFAELHKAYASEVGFVGFDINPLDN